MHKNLMRRNGVVAAVALGAMALVGCGEQGGSTGSGADAGATDDAVSGAVTPVEKDGHGPADGHDHGSSSAGSAGAVANVIANDGSVALNDSSADGAINTYINRLKAGDLIGATEICVAGAPGTDNLLKIGRNIEKMLANPDQASVGEASKALFVNDLKAVDVVKQIEEEGVVVYEVTVLNKTPKMIRVELREGSWRVIPPTEGLPM